MAERKRLTLEKLDENAKKRLGELKKDRAGVSIQLKENLGDLKKYLMLRRGGSVKSAPI